MESVGRVREKERVNVKMGQNLKWLEFGPNLPSARQ